MVKKKRVVVEKRSDVFGVRGGKKVSGFGRKGAFVEKATFVFEAKMKVSVGGNWL
ncbi:MAG: hypothetical protein ACYTFW_22620 [Planctomycetota bacterium]